LTARIDIQVLSGRIVGLFGGENARVPESVGPRIRAGVRPEVDFAIELAQLYFDLTF